MEINDSDPIDRGRLRKDVKESREINDSDPIDLPSDPIDSLTLPQCLTLARGGLTGWAYATAG